jgi:hypothetical protein
MSGYPPAFEARLSGFQNHWYKPFGIAEFSFLSHNALALGA